MHGTRPTGSDAIVIADEHTTVTLHGFEDPHRDGYGVWAFMVRLEAVDLSAETFVVDHPAQGKGSLQEFVADIAESWKGWDGIRTWEAMEHQLKIEAIPGRLTFLLQAPRSGGGGLEEAWAAQAAVSVEPGEQMVRLAEDVRAVAASIA